MANGPAVAPPPTHFIWPAHGDQPPPAAMTGTLPDTGPIAEFKAAGIVISEPTDPKRPWVIGSGDRVLKVYDLRAFGDDLAKHRAQAEAETAQAVSGVPGIVTTYRTGLVGPYLVIEMERLGETVADHLTKVAAGAVPALPAEVWGRLLDDVAAALDRLHRRHVVHRDIKPANLLFDRSGERLVVGDFSISTRGGRRWRRPPDDSSAVRGTDRYVAPELFDGRISAAADQYSLAVTARDVLGDDLPAAAVPVLARGAAADPLNRFIRIVDFGIALRSAVDPASPHRLSSRLVRVKPVWRNAWAPALVAGLLAYLALFRNATRTVSPADGLITPLTVTLATAAIARVAGSFAAKRSQPRLALATQPWFPIAVFALLMATLTPLLNVEQDDLRKYVAYSAIGAFGLWAWLGSVPRDAGEGIVRAARRWELVRRRARMRPQRWPVVNALVVGAVAGLTVAPYAFNRTKPKATPAAADHYEPIVVAAHFRSALLRSDIAGACKLTAIPTSSRDVSPCSAWAPVVEKWMRADIAAKGPAFTRETLPSIHVTYVNRSEKHTGAVWSLHAGDRFGPLVGTMEVAHGSRKVVDVAVTRLPPSKEVLSTEASNWDVEMVHGSAGWHVTGIQTCPVSVGRCTVFSQLDQRALSSVRYRR